jgi:hypothetical protein
MKSDIEFDYVRGTKMCFDRVLKEDFTQPPLRFVLRNTIYHLHQFHQQCFQQLDFRDRYSIVTLDNPHSFLVGFLL